MSKSILIFVIILIFCFNVGQKMTAQVPRNLTVQGVLTDSTSRPIADGIYTVMLRLYDSLLGGNAVYTEEHTTPIFKGLFNLTLGGKTPLPQSLAFNKQYFVGISYGDKPEIARIPLSSVPYSLMAETVPDGSITTTKIADGSITLEKLSTELRTEKKTATGLANQATGQFAFIGGGDLNVASGNYSAVTGGNTNKATANFAIAAGGSNNTASAINATVSGGLTNTANATNATISGGGNNIVSGQFGIIGGGSTNNVSGTYSAIAGGRSNIVSGTHSIVGGGYSNMAYGSFSSILGGYNNKALGDYSSVLGGYELTLTADADRSIGFLANTGSRAMTVSTPNVAVFGNTDLWLASNDGTTRALKLFSNNLNASGAYPSTTAKNVSIKAPDALANDYNLVLPATAGTSGQILTTNGSGILSWAPASLTNFTELLYTAAPNATVPVVQLLATNAATNVDIAITPKGAGALTAQVADNAATGGNKRGTNAVDWQMNRFSVDQVASGNWSTLSGGYSNTANGNTSTVSGGVSNTASGDYSTVSGGEYNTASGTASTVSGGFFNAASGTFSTVSGSHSNTASGSISTVSGGYGNTAGGDYSTISGGVGLTLNGTSSFGFLSNSIGSRNMTIAANNIAVFGNTDLWLASNDGTTRALKLFSNNLNAAGAYPGGTAKNVAIKAPDALAADYTLLLPPNAGANAQVLTTNGSGTLSWAAASLTNFTESVNTSAPNATVPVVRLLATNAATNVDIALSPKGSGALTAQVADNAITGGNKRGINAVDWQMLRSSSSQVASGFYSTVSGGYSNTTSEIYSTVGGGGENTASNGSSTVSGGYLNTASASYSTVSGGYRNTASGNYSTVSGGSGLTLSGSSSIGFLGNDGTRNMTVAANSVAVFGNTDLWLASNDGTTRALKLFSNNLNAAGTYPGATAKNVAIKAPDALVNDYTLVLPPNAGGSGQVLTTNGSGTLSWAATSLTNFTESVNTSAPNATVPVVRLLATNAATNVDIALSPKGSGALTAQVADNAITGGNKRGINAVDWQTARSSASQVSSGSYATVGGGGDNTATNFFSTVSGGYTNSAINNATAVGGGSTNTASGTAATISGGISNTVSGDFSSISGGYGLTVNGTKSFGFLGNDGTRNMTVAANNVAVFGNTDLWLASNDGTTRALKLFSNNLNASGTYPSTTAKNVAIKAPNSLAADYILVLPPDAGANAQVLTTNGSGTLSWAAASLTNFTESVNTSAPNATIPVVRLLATNAATNVDIALSPKGTGALTAQVADNTTTGGNKRGTRAVDWQMERGNVAHVASGPNSTIGGGKFNTAGGTESTVAGGNSANASGTQSFIGGGVANTASNLQSVVSGGFANTASGDKAFIGSGESNTVSGGHSVVGGGFQNTATGYFTTIPGGRGLTLGADRTFGFHANTSAGDRNMIISVVNTAVFGNTDLWLASNDGTTRALKLFSNNLNAAGAYPSTTAKNVAIKAPDALAADYTLVLPPDAGANGQVLKTNGSGTLSWTATGLTNFTESVNTTAPNATVPVVRLLATNAATDVDIALSPKGAGALIAQVADNTTTGGNKRGESAVDWQLLRNASSQVASGSASTVSGGQSNTANQPYSSVSGGFGNTASDYSTTVSGGWGNTASSNYSTVSGGISNTASGPSSTVSGGASNTASGDFSAISGGFGLTLNGLSSMGFLGNISGTRNMTVAANSVAVFGNTDLWLASNDGTTRALKLFSNNLNGSGAYPSTTAKNVAIKAPNSLSADYTLVLPPDAGADGQVLKTNGSGTLSWTSNGGGGGLTGIQTYAATAGGTNNFTISNTTAGFHILTYTGDAGTGTTVSWTLPAPSSYSSGSVLNFLTQAETAGGAVASTSLTTPSGVIYSLVAGKGTTAFTIGSVSQFALMTDGTNWYRIR